MSDQFVAEIRMFGGNFAPTGWALCAGQLMPISQNTALFSLLGTTYGGDGKSTFALPNLFDSVPIHAGQGPGLSLRDLGESGGADTVTLLTTELPAHTHALQASSNGATQSTPVGHVPAASQAGNVYGGVPNIAMHPNSLDFTGSGLPHNNQQPYQTLTFIIALQGIYPPHNAPAGASR